jgi:regulator of protease activity HflC (stomatin/prohibitin superfamily)
MSYVSDPTIGDNDYAFGIGQTHVEVKDVDYLGKVARWRPLSKIKKKMRGLTFAQKVKLVAKKAIDPTGTLTAAVVAAKAVRDAGGSKAAARKIIGKIVASKARKGARIRQMSRRRRIARRWF